MVSFQRTIRVTHGQPARYLQSAVSDQVISLAQAIQLQQVLDKPLPNSRNAGRRSADGCSSYLLPVTQPGGKFARWPRHLPGCCILKAQAEQARTTAKASGGMRHLVGND